MTGPAPIALFVNRRPDHAALTLDALARNELAADSRLVVYLRTSDDDELRDVAGSATGFASVDVVESDDTTSNDDWYIDGITAILEEEERAIILDEDLVSSPHFLTFINESLDRFADVEDVISVCGYTITSKESKGRAHFMPGAHFWGWGTWRRGWQLLERDSRKLLQGILDGDLAYRLDLDGAEPLTTELAKGAHRGEAPWFIRWMASAILHDRVTLYPPGSLLRKAAFMEEDADPGFRMAFDTELIGSEPIVPDRFEGVDIEERERLRRHVVGWQRLTSPRRAVYYQIAGILPEGWRRSLHTARTKRAIRRIGR